MLCVAGGAPELCVFHLILTHHIRRDVTRSGPLGVIFSPPSSLIPFQDVVLPHWPSLVCRVLRHRREGRH